jgi:hypothetical protein
VLVVKHKPEKQETLIWFFPVKVLCVCDGYVQVCNTELYIQRMAEDVWFQGANLVVYPSGAYFVSGFIPKLQSVFILVADMNM